MSEIVNLRQARKRKVRAESAAEAAANRAAHGRSRAEKVNSRLARELERRKLEEHRREASAGPLPQDS